MVNIYESPDLTTKIAMRLTVLFTTQYESFLLNYRQITAALHWQPMLKGIKMTMLMALRLDSNGSEMTL